MPPIRDHVNVAGSNVCGSIVVLSYCFVHLGTISIPDLGRFPRDFERLNCVDQMAAFLIQAFSFSRKFGLYLLLPGAVPVLRAWLPSPPASSSSIGSQFDFLKPKGVERIADVHFHHLAEFRNCGPCPFNSLLGCKHVAGSQRPKAVVHFSVVSTEH